MSDTDEAAGDGGDGEDDGAPDGFDKEAEREKLREKYERDKERRAVTERMGDLLLGGATMTNMHCNNCGSPIFRKDGEEFCPSCGATHGLAEDEAATDADEGAGGEADAVAADVEAGGGPTTAEVAGGAARVPTDARPPDERADDDGAEVLTGGPAGPDGREPPSVDDVTGGHGPEPTVPTGGPGAAPSGGEHPASTGEAPTLAQAKASLRRSIVSLSEQAAQSDEPRHAQALLEAAREAAEALAALDDD